TGLWHGANWTFVFWGLFHGFFVSVENLPSKKKDGMDKSAGSGSLLLKLAKHIYVMAVVCTGFVIFRADSLKQAFSMILTAFTGACSTIVQKQALLTFCSLKTILVMCAAGILSMKLYAYIPGFRHLGGQSSENTDKNRSTLVYILMTVLLLLSMISLAGGGYNPFIYFRF
ncbi:MAG: hypothetical protein J6P87_08210, partial [Lachnospiraceae bacterium]|nr:hypothetical protein [Lachnospiraceae bacterium]